MRKRRLLKTDKDAKTLISEVENYKNRSLVHMDFLDHLLRNKEFMTDPDWTVLYNYIRKS